MLPESDVGNGLGSEPVTQARAARESEIFAAADALQSEWRLDEAEHLIRASEELIIDHGRAHFVLSVLAMQQGCSDVAFAEAARAEQLQPLNRAVRHHCLTLQKLREPPDPQSFIAGHRAFGADFSGQEANLHVRLPRSFDPNRSLKVAYLTPDAHLAMARFIECIRRFHDPNNFQAALYYAFPCELGKLRAVYPNVRHVSVVGMGSQEVAELLAADATDIAIDLAGHGAGNQLLALQRRPAPIQMTWLDYVATTGVPAIDYRIADAVTDPSGSEAWSSEVPLRLPVAAWSYAPHPAAPPPRANSIRNGSVVLGSPCVPLKLSDTTLACWRSLLLALPDCRLRLLGVPQGKARERVQIAMAGIEPHRIEILGRLPMDAYYRAINDFDIALDPGPFSGATTTLDCLWQGIPVVTIPGVLPHSRSTASILAHAGLEHWVADDTSSFIDIVARLAGDAEARLRWRRTARSHLGVTALFDGARFVAELETGLRASWKRYVDPHAPAETDERSSPPNHNADRRGALGLDKSARRKFSEAMIELGAALRQAPAWTEARTAYWSAVKALAQSTGAGSLCTPFPNLDMVKVVSGAVETTNSTEFLPGQTSTPRSIALMPGMERDAYALAAASSQSEWMLFGDAGCTHWWTIATSELQIAMSQFDALSSLGIGHRGHGQLAGSRVHASQGVLIGRIWPFRGWTLPATLLCGNWLLVRTQLLRQSLDVPQALRMSTAGLDSLGEWHASLTLALAGVGARLAACPGLLGVDALDDRGDAALARWQHGLVADHAPGRERIDVGRLFGVRQAEVAQLLIRTVQIHTVS